MPKSSESPRVETTTGRGLPRRRHRRVDVDTRPGRLFARQSRNRGTRRARSALALSGPLHGGRPSDSRRGTRSHRTTPTVGLQPPFSTAHTRSRPGRSRSTPSPRSLAARTPPSRLRTIWVPPCYSVTSLPSLAWFTPRSPTPGSSRRRRCSPYSFEPSACRRTRHGDSSTRSATPGAGAQTATYSGPARCSRSREAGGTGYCPRYTATISRCGSVTGMDSRERRAHRTRIFNSDRPVRRS